VRRELRALQRELGLTVLQVTHDFAEAGTLGDLAVLVEDGVLVQSGPPEALFRRPSTSAAAEFLGAENVYAGTAARLDASADVGAQAAMQRFTSGPLTLLALSDVAEGACHAVVRGEDVVLARERAGASSARNAMQGTVMEIAVEGPIARVTVDLEGVPLVAMVTTGAVRALDLRVGTAVVASVKATAVHLC
jgi:molybdopterin-binding protein